MDTFFKPILGLEKVQASFFWQASETYLSCSRTVMRVDHIEGKKIVLVSAKDAQHIALKALKIASYITLILPLLALGVRSWFRRNYTFEMLTPAPGSSAGTVAAVATPLLNRSSTGTSFAKGALVSPENAAIDVAANNTAVIEQIKKAQQNGLRVALFIGREDTQSVPSEKNWLWVSLDSNMWNPPNEKHPHLKLDFNADPKAPEIAHLFDKVVVDNSVFKFMTFPWLTLRNLVANKETAEVIVEAGYGECFLNQLAKEIDYRVQQGFYVLPSFPAETQLERKKAAAEEFLHRTEEFLKKNFQEVTLIKKAIYPCRGPEEEIIGDFWILKNPKPTSSKTQIPLD